MSKFAACRAGSSHATGYPAPFGVSPQKRVLLWVLGY